MPTQHFCILLLCLAAVPLFLGMSNPQSGWDYRVFAGAVQAVNHGENPYVLANIDQYTGDNLPFTYPPTPCSCSGFSSLF